MARRVHFVLLAAVALAACGGKPPAKNAERAKGPEAELAQLDEWSDPAAALPKRSAAPKVLAAEAPTLVFQHATILTAAGKRFEDGTLVLERGRIAAVGGPEVAVPKDARVVDAKGAFLTPGIIDSHSHVGVGGAPGVRATDDTNEASAPFTPGADAGFGYWSQDPSITRAMAGGITVAHILPGSANIIGGRGLTVEMRPGRSAWEVAVPSAPRTLKMACGENPKAVYGSKNGPKTRLGEYAVLRDEFQKGAEYNLKLAEYRREHAIWEKKKKRAEELDRAAAQRGEKDRAKPIAAPTPPNKTLEVEVLAAVLRGEILVQIHCYRQDDLAQMMAIADEFGFKIRSFHHALEAYKVRDELARRGIAINTWADWWGFKMEAFDGIPENAALFHEAGGRPVIHSDSPIGIQRLNQEAAKAMTSGRAAGIDITENDALRWVTANPAWVLGIEGETGTLEAGKRADVVLWNHHPLSVYALPKMVVIGGRVEFDWSRGLVPTDFELGNSAGSKVEAP